MLLFFFTFYCKRMLNLQFRNCNDDFVGARLHDTESELKLVGTFALVKVSHLCQVTSLLAVE